MKKVVQSTTASPGGTSVSSPPASNKRWQVFLVCGALVLLVGLVFGQTLRYGFVNFDDDQYVYKNPNVAGGLTWAGIRWAFTHSHSGNWHPLTWISHMLDCQLYGLNAGGHHLTNVLLHAATAILLFLVLRQMTGALWPSAFVAAVFAVHPLRVESVAWVAERKDVLSGLFFMLTLWAYACYADRKVASDKWRMTGTGTAAGITSPVKRSSSRWYWLALVSFALGLISKPMLVTLPLVLLLLDYWPLRRISNLRSLVWEKIPFFILALASGTVTLSVQKETIQTLEEFPLLARIGNAFIAYVAYLAKLIWPAGLSPFYPHPGEHLPLGRLAFAVVLLSYLSFAVFGLRRKRPYLFIGWWWYLVMLLPVIGLIQVGGQAMADRYTYLPQIGIGILVVWGVVDLAASWRHRRRVLWIATGITLATLVVCAWDQTANWRSSETLWRHTLACDPNNAEAHDNLGKVLVQTGRAEEAIAHFANAAKADLSDPMHFNGLGVALFSVGRFGEAFAQFQKALEIDPDHAQSHYNYGLALLKVGQVDESIVHFTRALDLRPDYPDAHYNMGMALMQNGQTAEAIAHWEKAVELEPDFVLAGINLAWVLATSPEASLRNGTKAVQWAELARHLSGNGDPMIEGALAAAYAETGRYREATAIAQRALQLAESKNQTEQIEALQKQIELYQAGLPFHDSVQTNVPVEPTEP